MVDGILVEIVAFASNDARRKVRRTPQRIVGREECDVSQQDAPDFWILEFRERRTTIVLDSAEQLRRRLDAIREIEPIPSLRDQKAGVAGEDPDANKSIAQVRFRTIYVGFEYKEFPGF